MNNIVKRKDYEVVAKPASATTGFQSWSLLIIAMLLLPLCACSVGNSGEAAKTETKETAESAVIEEESPFGRWGAILPIPEGSGGVSWVGAVYRNSKQEIIIHYTSRLGKATTASFFNFSKGELEIECKDDECTKEVISGLNKLEEEKVSHSKYTSFGGGFRRRVSGGEKDSTSIDTGFETLLSDGTVRYEKILRMGTGKAWALDFRFYALNNNIVLGLAFNNPFVVVFNNNLISPFFENNKSLIKMDGKLADSIYRVCSADARVKVKNSTEQTIQDIIDTSRNNMGAAGIHAESKIKQIIQDNADACFFEIIKDGVSDEFKKTLEKKVESFYVDKQPNDIHHRINGEWGMFLPLPEEYYSFWLSGVYLNAKQEIIILYSLRIKHNEGHFWRIFNLTRGILEHEYKVIADEKTQPWIDEKTAGLNEVRSASARVDTPIGEGFSLRDRQGWGTPVLRYGGFEITSPNGDTRYEKIIWISPKKHEFIVTTSHATDIKEVNYIHAEGKYLSLYKLDEKTLLGHLYGDETIHAFIIFRNDMTSQYFENNPLLIQIDGKHIDSVYEDCISYDSSDAYEKADKCLVEFLKGEYPWLNQ